MVPIMKCKDIETRDPIEHLDFKVLEALLKGHIIKSEKHGEFRYIGKDQPMYQIEDDSKPDEALVYYARESGFYQRSYTFTKSLPENQYTPENADGFKWTIAYGDLESVKKIIKAMSKEEKIQAAMGLAFENAVSPMNNR
jgi:hypothetical protein